MQLFKTQEGTEADIKSRSQLLKFLLEVDLNHCPVGKHHLFPLILLFSVANKYQCALSATNTIQPQTYCSSLSV